MNKHVVDLLGKSHQWWELQKRRRTPKDIIAKIKRTLTSSVERNIEEAMDQLQQATSGETAFDINQGSLLREIESGQSWNFRNANLKGANLRGSNFRKVDLSGADLSKANLSAANLDGADLGGANLTDADLTLARITNANFFEARGIDTSILEEVSEIRIFDPDIDPSSLEKLRQAVSELALASSYELLMVEREETISNGDEGEG